jgi:endonuclease V-like protein UPF0215 family
MVTWVKPEIRIVGFDDAAFDFGSAGKSVPVVGVIYRGGSFIDGMLRTDVTIDGADATDRLAERINSTRHRQQLKVIMLDGITLGGFNVVDAKRLHEETSLPVIIVNRKMPDLKAVRKALERFPDSDSRWQAIRNAGKIKTYSFKNGKNLYYQSIGLDDEEAEEILALSSTHGFVPEPLRVAHLIATAIVKGESAGRA